MNFLKRAIVAIGVFALFAAFLISQGKWEAAVVQPVAEVFGVDTARNVDEFGKRSNDVTGKVLDLGGKMIDGYFSANGTADPAVVGEVLEQAPPVQNVRIPDYDRQLFGEPWADVDGNGCATRDDILARDLTQVVKKGTCQVQTGILADPYTGKTINFERGPKTSSKVQIDHVFSLSAAWKAGAHSWTDQQRLAFANDPDNLLAVDGPTNSGKSDKTPADWLPANDDYRCTYIAKYVYVAGKYGLAIQDNDRDAINRALDGC